ncbi:GNAT family N-acetyltransferase [Actinoplanes sp. NPDC026619]|uniref:GNAT family N-acetyltransferase n=1 Tax=Actinoplanes sp. NPDC026619 TaxID=3155798 RepID=UPI0033EFF167
MRIRDANDQDVDAIVAVGQQTWPATYAFAGDDYVRNGLATWWSAAAIVRSLRDTTVLVAEDETGVAGVGNIDLRPDVPIIWKLYVLPGTQGTGAGSALMAALLQRAPGQAVRLEYVDGNSRAAGFYAARGFTELRREPGEQPDWPDTVWLERRP